jgi:hypothetical protein
MLKIYKLSTIGFNIMVKKRSEVGRQNTGVVRLSLNPKKQISKSQYSNPGIRNPVSRIQNPVSQNPVSSIQYPRIQFNSTSMSFSKPARGFWMSSSPELSYLYKQQKYQKPVDSAIVTAC